MAISKVQGVMLEDNLLRFGQSLAVDTDVLYIDGTTGNIGINTNTPSEKLEVQGTVKLNSLSFSSNTISEGTSSGLVFSLGGEPISVSGSTITNVLDPTNLQDVVTVNYLNNTIAAQPTNIIFDENSALTIDKDDITHITTLDFTPNGNLNFKFTDTLASFYNDVLLTNVLVTGNTISTKSGSGLNLALKSDTGDIVFDTNSSIVLPVGNSPERPPTPQTGAMRFNTFLTRAEIFDGTNWGGFNPDFFELTSENITPDGISQTYPLSQNASSTSILVSMNGILQTPTVSYSVSNNLITFVNPPQIGDIINIRYLAEMSQVQAVANGVGDTYVMANDDNIISVIHDETLLTITDPDIFIHSTSSLGIPVGTTAERPSQPVAGALRFNSTESYSEIYDGAEWVSLTGERAGLEYDSHNFILSSDVGLPFDTTADHVLVSIQGILQSPASAYNIINNNTLQFTSSPALTDSINIRHIDEVQVVETDTIIADGVNNIYTLSHSSTTFSVIVSVNGILQTPTESYTVSGNNLILTNTPTNGQEIYVADIVALGNSEKITADGVNNSFTLTESSVTEKTIISINGILQEPTVAYTVSGNTLSFASVPVNSDEISVRYLSVPLESYRTTIEKEQRTFQLTHTGITGDILVSIDGLLLSPVDDYTVQGSNLVLQTTPTVGSDILIRYISKISNGDFETVTGDGVNTIYPLTQYPTPESILVVLNGKPQVPFEYYNISGNSIIFSTAPSVGSVFSIRYLTEKSVSQSLFGDGSTVDFSMSVTAPKHSILVMIDGVVQTPTADYSTNNFTISFVNPPGAGAAINIRFMDSFTYTDAITDANGTTRVQTTDDNVLIDVNNDNIINIDENTITVNKSIVPTVNSGIDLGTPSTHFDKLWLNQINGNPADVAENFSGDKEYDPGTVLVFDEVHEVTESSSYADSTVVGIVSTEPAYLLNSQAKTPNAIALCGRVPCKVKGPIHKGDLLTTSDIPGCAQRYINDGIYRPGVILGKAMESTTKDIDIITVFVTQM